MAPLKKKPATTVGQSKTIKNKRALNTLHVELHTKKPKGKPRGDGGKAIEPYRFKPGQSGNPGGRPKSGGHTRISDAYAGMLAQDMPPEFKEAIGVDPEEKFTWAEAMALQLMKKVLNPTNVQVSFKALQELREVTEGKLPEKSELGGPGGTPLNPGIGLPQINVNFKSSPHAASAGEEKRPIDNVTLPVGPVVVPPTVNVPVVEVQESTEPVNLPTFDQGF